MNMRELIEKALYAAGLDAEDWTDEFYQEYRDICEYTEKPNAAERRAMQSAYNAALMEVSEKLTQLNRHIKQGL